MDKKLVVLEYQDNFADNLSTYAYGKLAQKKFNAQLYWTNDTASRDAFENKMKDFRLKKSYISNIRANEIAKKSKFMDYKDFNRNNLKGDKILSLKNLKIDDIENITNDITDDFKFNNLNFVKNYDILEEINSENSIGLYINKKDKADISYIEKALTRLNKYLKHPKLYIFTSDEIILNSPVQYKTINIGDWREEFYFLQSCKHKIIHCSINSYSEGVWASIISKKPYCYVVYSKSMHSNKIPERWISV